MVVVNDGLHFTTTDEQGRWTLTSDTCQSKFVAISTPADYELNNDHGLARFYIPIAKTVTSGSNNDFVLRKRKKGADRFTYIAISDLQMRNEKEVERWKSETLKDLSHTVGSLRSRGEIIGMTLGDLVFDTPDLFPTYAASCQNLGLTMFQTIGNHDLDKRYQDLHNMRLGTPVYAEQNYFRFFGPTDYSFNIGKIHVVTMKNINYVGRKQYIEAITDQQLAWLEKDLSYVPKGSTVFLNMHAAAWNTVSADGNIRNAAELKRVLKDYRVHVFCGHTHFYENIVVNGHLYQHNITVTWQEDGVDKGAMEQFTATDEMYIRMENAIYRDVDEEPTGHLFRCKPGKKAKSITVTFTNRFGEKYMQEIKL